MATNSFQLLFESAPGMYIVLLPDFSIAAASDAYLESTMTRREEITGRGIFDVFPDNPENDGGKGASNLLVSLNKVLSSKAMHIMPMQRYDIQNPDGSYQERYWSALNKPVLNAKKEVQYIIHRVEDVSDFMRMKNEQEKREKITEALLDSFEEMRAEIYKRSQELQDTNKLLLDEIAERKKQELLITQMNIELEQKVSRGSAEVIQAEKRFRVLIENSHEAISLLDENFDILYRSPAAEKMTGWTSEERKNGSGKEYTHPDDVPLLQSKMKEILANPGKTFTLEMRSQHKKGHYIWLSGIFTSLLHDPTVRAIVVNMQDITERKKREEELALFASIINSSDDAIFSTSPTGKITSWNRGAEKIFGYSQAEVSGENFLLLIPPGYEQEQERILGQIRKGEHVNHYETERRRKDGTVISVSLCISPIMDSSGNITGVSKICREITDRKKASDDIRKLNIILEKRAAELADSNEELERFAYIASHDLQEPLRMVSSFLQLLRKRYSDKLDSTAMEYIHYAVDGSDRMKKLIQDLLQYSQLDMAKEDFAQVDMNEVVQDASTLLEATIKENAATLKSVVLPVAYGRRQQLVQLLQNLLSNALKYRSAEDPVIEIGYSDAGRHWEFFVRDNGIGIDPKFNEKIFIIFQRLHNKSEYSGTGIGLAICRKIVDRHGGKLWVESAPGEGSTFRFTLSK